MVKFRKNHRQQGNKRGNLGIIVKTAILFLLFFGGSLGYRFFNIEAIQPNKSESTDRSFFLPTHHGELVHHQHFSLSYIEEHEQAEWVAYELTKASLKKPNVKRTNDYRADPSVRTETGNNKDFKYSGYDRGHLVPAADMAFSKTAMSESFFMSNLSPQVHHFNGGIWRELEEQTRDWAYNFNQLFIISGPILKQTNQKTIGYNKLTVPEAYYKIILDITEPENKAIAFIIPNETSELRLKHFAVSIDEVEKITNIDFFPNLLSDELETRLEDSFDISLWHFSEKRYQKRIKEWNNR